MRRLVILQGGLKSSANTPKAPEISIMKTSEDHLSVGDSDREEIIQMIEFGWSDDQILQMLPHIQRGSITAFRAHVTRGTYEPGVISGANYQRRDVK